MASAQWPTSLKTQGILFNAFGINTYLLGSLSNSLFSFFLNILYHIFYHISTIFEKIFGKIHTFSLDTPTTILTAEYRCLFFALMSCSQPSTHCSLEQGRLILNPRQVSQHFGEAIPQFCSFSFLQFNYIIYKTFNQVLFYFFTRGIRPRTFTKGRQH